MPRYRPRTPARSGARATLLVAMFGAMALVGMLLAYEAWMAARSQRVTVERALGDYASVAAWEFQGAVRKRIDGALQLALSPLVAGTAASPYESLLPVAALATAAEPALPCPGSLRPPPGRTVLRLDLRDGSLAVGGRSPSGGPAERAAWMEAMTGFVHRRASPEQPIGMVESGAGGLLGVGVKYAQHGAPLAAYAFTVCPDALGSALFASVFREHPLLPVAVRGVLPNDSLLAVTVYDAGAGGKAIFAVGADTASRYASDVALDGVIGEQWHARVSVRPEATTRVLVGRPGATRVPVLVILLLVTAALAVAVLMQLRREHELAALRTEFTASVSHELRTPLAQILLYGETLSLGRARSEVEQRLAADTIVREARRLMQMVDKVLLFGRVRHSLATNEARAVPLGPLVHDVARGLASITEPAGVTISVAADESVTARGEEAALRQVLLNLLDNSVKHGGAPHGGGTIRVRVAAVAGWAHLSVTDDGPGVPADDRERVWEPYVRLDGNGARAPGTGIGLSVVRDLVTAMGGRAWVEGSATFVVALPLAVPDAAP